MYRGKLYDTPPSTATELMSHVMCCTRVYTVLHVHCMHLARPKLQLYISRSKMFEWSEDCSGENPQKQYSLHSTWCVCHSNYHYSSIYVHAFSSVFALPHLHIKLLCQFGAWVAFYGFQALVKMFIAKSLTTSACEQQNLQSLKHCSKNKKLMCIW